MGVTKNSAAYCCTGAVANGCEQMHALMCMSTRTHNSSHRTCELFGDRIHGGGGTLVNSSNATNSVFLALHRPK